MPSSRKYNPKKEAEQIAQALKRRGKLVQPDNAARWQAVERLEALSHPAAIPHLVDALHDPFPAISARAASALLSVWVYGQGKTSFTRHPDARALRAAFATVSRRHPVLPFDALHTQKQKELYDAFQAARRPKR